MGNVNVRGYERLDPRTGRKIVVSGYSRFGKPAMDKDDTHFHQPNVGLHPQSSSPKIPAETPKSAGSKLPSFEELRKMPLPTQEEIRNYLEVITNARNAARKKKLAELLSSKTQQQILQIAYTIDSINPRLNGFINAYKKAFTEAMELYNKNMKLRNNTTLTNLSNLQPIITTPPKKPFKIGNVTIGKNIKFFNTKIGNNDLDFPGTELLTDLINNPHFIAPLTNSRYICVKTYLYPEESSPTVASAIVNIADQEKYINFNDFKEACVYSISGFIKKIWEVGQRQFKTPGGKLHSVCLLNPAEAAYLFPKLIRLGDIYDE